VSQTIRSTRTKECTDCKKPVEVVELFRSPDTLTVVTECYDCQIKYFTTFALPLNWESHIRWPY